MQTIRILILEDDLETLSILLSKLSLFEKELEVNSPQRDFSVVTLSEYTQVEEYINKNGEFKFDVVLLDRDCKAGGSFHVLDIEAIGADKIISISSMPQYNEEAVKRGVKYVVWKDYQYLDDFADQVVKQIEGIVRKMPLIEEE